MDFLFIFAVSVVYVITLVLHVNGVYSATWYNDDTGSFGLLTALSKFTEKRNKYIHKVLWGCHKCMVSLHSFFIAGLILLSYYLYDYHGDPNFFKSISFIYPLMPIFITVSSTISALLFSNVGKKTLEDQYEEITGKPCNTKVESDPIPIEKQIENSNLSKEELTNLAKKALALASKLDG